MDGLHTAIVLLIRVQRLGAECDPQLSANLQQGADEYVFNSQTSTRLNLVTIYKLFRAIAREAGLPESLRHPHTLKHTAAMLMVDAGANAFLIRQHLGLRQPVRCRRLGCLREGVQQSLLTGTRKSIASTAIYAMPTDETAGKAVLNALASTF